MGSPAASAESWRDGAACVGADPRIFTDPRPDTGDARRAVEICQTCPVKEPCLDTALQIEASADVGIWGGTTPHTRSRLRRAGGEQQTGPRATQAAVEPALAIAGTDADRGRLQFRVDEHGDYTDPSGRVIIFEIHGQPPYMLMIDGKPRARTATIHDAAGLAGRLLTRDRATSTGHPQALVSRQEATRQLLRRP